MIVPELIRQRWSMPNLWNDCVSGIIIATFVIFSFLSLVRFPAIRYLMNRVCFYIQE